ncbi:MAG TPA: hypothetical protein PKN45_01100, partial [Candidatus Limiplasma sp.]|nr:hypothetical protein [Candidatus Limiplasma sp.]
MRPTMLKQGDKTNDSTVGHQKNRRFAILLPLCIAVTLLGILYFALPKAKTRYDSIQTLYCGLTISEVMAANSSAVPDENGKFSDW